MASASAGLKRRSALIGTLRAPIGGQAVADQAIERSVLGTGATTSRRTPAQEKAISDFDKSALAASVSEHQPKYINNMPDAGSVLAARAAATKADPYALDYGEKGTFGSQQTAPEVRRAQPVVSPVSRTDGLAPQGVSGSAMATSGLAGATRPPGPSPAVAPAAPVSTLPTPSSVPAPTGLATPTYQPTAAETPSLPTTSYSVSGEPAPSSVPAGPTPSVTPAPTASSTPPATPVLAGRTTEAGVSNSQAAQFTQPTKANPIPETPTTPVMDVNDFDKRGKRVFAGF